MSAGDRASVTVFVGAPPPVAFRAFTEEIDQWWRQGRKYRIAGKHPGALAFEPRTGGRLFETVHDPAGDRVYEMGTILVWEPPARLVFEWRGVSFAPGEKTEVEVRFEAASDGTRVHLTHRGFASLRDGHPVRHGLAPAPFVAMIGMWWGELLSAYRERF